MRGWQVRRLGQDAGHSDVTSHGPRQADVEPQLEVEGTAGTALLVGFGHVLQPPDCGLVKIF